MRRASAFYNTYFGQTPRNIQSRYQRQKNIIRDFYATKIMISEIGSFFGYPFWSALHVARDNRRTNTTTMKCAPSKNLNVAYPQFETAKEMYAHLREITKPVSALSSVCSVSSHVIVLVLKNVFCQQADHVLVIAYRVESWW